MSKESKVYILTPEEILKCTVTGVGETTTNSDYKDFDGNPVELKTTMIEIAPEPEGTGSLDSKTGKPFRKTVRSSEVPDLQSYIEEHGDAVVGQNVTVTRRIMVTNHDFYVTRLVDGKLVTMKHPTTGKPITANKLPITKFIGEGPITDSDAMKALRRIMDQTSKGGGFVQRFELTEDGSIKEAIQPNKGVVEEIIT